MKKVLAALALIGMSFTAAAQEDPIVVANQIISKGTRLSFDKSCHSVAWCQRSIKEAKEFLPIYKKYIDNGCQHALHAGCYRHDQQYKDIVENIASYHVQMANLKKRDAEDKAWTEKFKAETEARNKLPGVRIGMTPDDVIHRSSWGKPRSINRTTNRYGVSEQWVYGYGDYLYFENGKLSTIQN
jgi:hypothetical protein